MKEILVISKEFYPNETANTNCLYKVIDALQKRNYKITVVSGYRTSETDKEHETVFGCDLYRTVNKEQHIMDKLSTTFEGSFFKYLLFPILKLLYFFSVSSENRRMSQKCKELLKRNDYSLIISVLYPFSNHKIAYDIISKKNTWIMLNFDPFVYNSEKIPNAKKIYIKWLKKASGVINTNYIDYENERRNFNPFKNMVQIKHLSIPLPNLTVNDNIISNYPSKIIKLVYTGMFYEKIRRPEPLLEILKELDPTRYQVEFYGNSCFFLRDNFTSLPECVKLMGVVDIETCKRITEEADVLLNVSNTVTNQMPSKIFEYIGSGKPIINIYFSDNDPTLEYMNKYPKVFNLKAGEKINIKDFNNFLQDTEPIPPQELRIIYKNELSENVLNNIVCFLETC